VGVFGHSASLSATDAPVIVEVSDSPEGVVSQRLVKRLVRLELTELAVPPPQDPAASDAPLYYRVFMTPSGTVRVELWQVGVHHGARELSADGGSQLTARRIALAAAELARRLRVRRDAARAARERETVAVAVADTGGGKVEWQARPSAAIFARTVLVGPGDAWLTGADLRAGIRFDSGPRFDLGVSAMGGGVLDAEVGDGLRWLEVSVSPGYVLTLPSSGGLALDLGLDASAAALRLSGTPSLDGPSGPVHAWSARTAAHARIDVPMVGGWTASVGPEIGWMFTPLAMQDSPARSVDLGGLWLGLSAGLRLDPSRSLSSKP
jgi:hypothetical protein